MRKKSWHIFLFVLLVITFLAYYPVTSGFFQHDEWLVFDSYISGKENLLTFFIPAVSHYSPLTKLFFSLYVSAFRFNFFGYALCSIFNHIIVVYLACVFFSSLLKNRILSIIASLFFALAASGHQATSWIAADINTHGATIFGLLAVIVGYKYHRIWPAIFLLIISLLFKEITIAFFVIIPLMVLIFDKEIFINNRMKYLQFPLVGFIYLVFRFVITLFPRADVGSQIVVETQSISEILVNAVTFPAKIFTQSLIPTGLLLNMAKIITKMLPVNIRGIYGTTNFDNFVEQISLQTINWIVFILGILLIIYVIKKSRDRMVKKIIIFGWIFVVLNSFIYVLSPGRSGSIPVVDSRNIYLPSLGAALFIVTAIYTLVREKIIVTILVLIPVLVLNIFWLEKELKILGDRGTERKNILYEIKNNYPVLPLKVVFYMVSDSSYYGLPETDRIFPFETNFGRTLMVWYLPTENLPKGFFSQIDFLHGLTDEGYRYFENRGFGYFRNLNSLLMAINESKLGKESIIAYQYDSISKTLTDITDQVREKIE